MDISALAMVMTEKLKLKKSSTKWLLLKLKLTRKTKTESMLQEQLSKQLLILHGNFMTKSLLIRKLNLTLLLMHKTLHGLQTLLPEPASFKKLMLKLEQASKLPVRLKKMLLIS